MLSNKDLDQMLQFGRAFGGHLDDKALEDAAEYIILADGEEARRLYFWFLEGVRNTTDSQVDTDICMSSLRARVKTYTEKMTDPELYCTCGRYLEWSDASNEWVCPLLSRH